MAPTIFAYKGKRSPAKLLKEIKAGVPRGTQRGASVLAMGQWGSGGREVSQALHVVDRSSFIIHNYQWLKNNEWGLCSCCKTQMFAFEF